MRVPNSEAERSGLAHDQVKIKEEYGGGYPANVEGLHHLHCLVRTPNLTNSRVLLTNCFPRQQNLLRKSLQYNYAYYAALGQGAFSNAEPIVKVHVTHCLDILRQQLMCSVDTGVLGQVWVANPVGGSPHHGKRSVDAKHDDEHAGGDDMKMSTGVMAFVDFNTKHQCKNFDAIREWARERQLPPAEETPKNFLAPPGGYIYPETP